MCRNLLNIFSWLFGNLFQRGGRNRSTTSHLSSDIELEKYRDEKDDEGFYSDAQIAEYFQHSHLVSLKGWYLCVRISSYEVLGQKRYPIS